MQVICSLSALTERVYLDSCVDLKYFISYSYLLLSPLETSKQAFDFVTKHN